ncbi:MAG: hypothetical protein IJW63_01860 [Lachnospiraceae bacterium]|nr:hypothetical protein [Lachnospiraceae bacterium]
MDSKGHVMSVGWMVFLLILSLLYIFAGELLPTIVVVIWMICPFITKICDFDEYVNLIPNILFALICGNAMFGDVLIIALGEAFLSFIMSTGYVDFVYSLVDDVRHKRRTELVENVRIRIRQRMDVYKKIADILSGIQKHPKAEKLIELLSICSTTTIRATYIEKQNLKNIDLLRQAEEINNQNTLRLNFSDKTISEIKSDIDKRVDDLRNDEKRLEGYSIYELKHYNI